VQRLLSHADNMLLDDDALNTLTGLILAAAIGVHRVLGSGLLESI
jgi:hypothetical protein